MSVRWTGYIRPMYAETYTFFVNADDQARLWVNDILVIDAWTALSSGPARLLFFCSFEFVSVFFWFFVWLFPVCVFLNGLFSFFNFQSLKCPSFPHCSWCRFLAALRCPDHFLCSFVAAFDWVWESLENPFIAVGLLFEAQVACNYSVQSR